MGEISKAVLITGCSSGIGRATAERLAGSGWTVYATARRTDSLSDLAAAGCTTLALDVTDDASMRAAVAGIEAEHGAVGVLVNNAGYGEYGPVEEVGAEQARRQFDTNVFGPARLAQLVLPGMRRQGWGRIVNLSSMGGRLTFPGGGWYHASKYALESLSDALRFETRPFGVRVVVVEPGFIRTSFGDTAGTTGGESTAPDSPYAPLMAAVDTSLHDAYEGNLARLGGGPEKVAAVIERAIGARNPRPRYKVTPSARVLIAARRWSTDRVWDASMRRTFKTPKRPTAPEA